MGGIYKFNFWTNGVLLLMILFIISGLSCQKLELVRVVDTSTDSISISGSTVTVYGTALDLGSGDVVSHGHCWATHEEPTIADNYSDNGPVYWVNPFYSILKSIKPGIKHYVRSYMFDGAQYTYGNVVSFEITAENIQFNTDHFSRQDDHTTVLVSSSTFGIGSINFTNHGHCWSLNDPPTINDSITSLGQYNSDTSFTSTLTNLTLGRYYIRGYLENEGVIVYSATRVYDSDIFVQSGTISINPDNTVAAQGNIVSLGVESIIDHGHCYSETTSKPDYNSSRTSLGPLYFPLPFNSLISGLNGGKTYYVRAYATDGSTVYYGEVRNFVAN